MSPVEVFVNEIKVFNWQRLSVTALSYSSECLITWLQELKVEFQRDQDCVTETKNYSLLCSEKTNTLCYGAKQNIMSEMLCAKMLKRHAENIEPLCQNIVLKILTSCWNIMLKILTSCWNLKYRWYAQNTETRNAHIIILCSKAEVFIHVAVQNLTQLRITVGQQSDHSSKISSQVWLEIHCFSMLSWPRALLWALHTGTTETKYTCCLHK